MPERQSLLLMASRRCALDCAYCPVVRGGEEMGLETATGAVAWLATSRARELELGFMGGEPLLRREWLDEVVCRARAAAGGRPVRPFIAASGRPLSAEDARWLAGVGATVLLGLDGGPEHCAARFGGDRASWDAAAAALARLREAGVEHAVNCVVGPGEAESLPARLAALKASGARRVQVSYMIGPLWTPGETDAFVRAVAAAVRAGGLEFSNGRGEIEPVLLKNGLIADEDGTVWLDNAVFLEKTFPSLRRSHRVGRLGSLPPRDEASVAPAEQLARAARALSKGSDEGRRWLSAVGVGRRVARALAGGFDPRDGAEDPVLRRGVVGAGLAEQDRFLKERLPGLDRVFLFVAGGCDLDCAFCRRKPEAASETLEALDARLAENAPGRRRIALVGNEPLAHPRIVDLVRRCRARGFKDVEVMTSGLRLEALAPALAEAGASSYAVALHGSRAEVHDALTRTPGSFAAAVRGIERARARGARVFVHANACRANLADLPALERLARERGWPFSIHPLRPKDPDGMNEPYERAAPGYAELRAALTGRVSSLTGFPACVAKRVQGRVSAPPEAVADSVKLYLLHQAFAKPEACAACADRGRCTGTFDAHLRLRPGDLRELVPC